MKSLFALPLASGKTLKILQITDTHLFASKSETLLGVNTYRSYHAVLNAIIAQQQDIDFIVATGDLAQDHSLTAYQHFCDGIAKLGTPCAWLPGNHDFQPAMTSVLASAGILPSKQILLGDNWQLLMLDSQVFGVPHGQLSDDQLQWMEACLQAYPERHTLVLLHHHPLASGCTWLDQHSLRNPQALADILQRYPLVTTLVCGHIHQEMDVDWQGKRLLASPSTSVQFKPQCTSFAIDTQAPGWRYLELAPNGEITTEVCRLPGEGFCPDLSAEGY